MIHCALMPVMGFQRTIKISVMAHLASHANVTQGDGVGFGFFSEEV